MSCQRALVFALLFAGQAAAQCTCPDGSAPKTSFPPCAGGPPSGAGCMGPPPGGGGAPAMGGGGGAPAGTATDFTGPGPYGASLLGSVGKTTVAGNTKSEITGAAMTLPVGTDIYGPFEAGFTAQQNFILEGLGCSDGNLGHVVGGIDTHTAEQMVAFQCGITLPRFENGRYVSLLDECGGHTQYHFHERFKCLYQEVGAHSTKVGEMADGKPMYGRWENYQAQQEPLLDACGGHWGFTPESPTVKVYHYHVQPKPPFTVGCFGPNPDDSLVTVEQCRALYPGCGDDATTVATPQGSKAYDLWCPCYDASGSNTGTLPLKVFSAGNTIPVATIPAPVDPVVTVIPLVPSPTPAPATTPPAPTTTTTTTGSTRPTTIPCPTVAAATNLRGIGGVEIVANGRSTFVPAGQLATCDVAASVSLDFRAATIDRAGAAAVRSGASGVALDLTSWATALTIPNAGELQLRAIPKNSCAANGCTVNKWAVQGNNAVLQGFAAGGQACYCDDACTQFRDCCADYQSTCGVFKF